MKNKTSQSCQSELNPQKYFWEMPLRKLSLIYKYSLFLRWTGFFAGFTISLHSSIVLYSTLEQILTNYKNTSILLKNLFMLFVFSILCARPTREVNDTCMGFLSLKFCIITLIIIVINIQIF